MNKKAFIVLMLICFAITCKSNKQKNKDNISGIIVLLIGKAEIFVSEKKVPAIIKSPVPNNSRIKTTENSFVVIQVTDKYMIALQPDSEVTITNSHESNYYMINVVRGTIISKVNKLSKGETYIVKIESTKAQVIGTEFSSTYRNNMFSHSVLKGKIAVVSEKCNNKETIIGKGYSVELTKNSKGNIIKEKVRPNTLHETLIIDKISEIPFVKDIEKAPIEMIHKNNRRMIEKLKHIDKKIIIEKRKENIIELMSKPTRTLAEIKQLFNKVELITLYNGKKMKGAIISQGKIFKIITETECLSIPKREIKTKTLIE